MQILNQSKVHIPEFSVSSDICLPLQSKQAFLFPKLMLPHLQCTIKETLLFMKIIHVKENTNKKKFKAVYNNAIYTPLTIIINFFLWHLFSWIRHHDVNMLSKMGESINMRQSESLLQIPFVMHINYKVCRNSTQCCIHHGVYFMQDL